MSMLWLTTALGVLMLLSAALIAGTLVLGIVVHLLTRGLELLLATGTPARTAPPPSSRRRSQRSAGYSQSTWTLSA